MQPPKCTCELPEKGAGPIFCKRHHCQKSRRMVELCHAGQYGQSPGVKYWQAWEEGRGPGQWTPDMPSRGLGDSVAKVTQAAGIKQCGGCKKRQAALNKRFPFQPKVETTVAGRRRSRRHTKRTTKAWALPEPAVVINASEAEVTIGVGIITAPRPGPLLLGRCVASLYKAGFESLTIFAEPESLGLESLPADSRIVRRPQRFGEWQNWLAGLAELLSGDFRPDAIMMVQDDVYFCRRVREFLGRVLWPSACCGAVQVYTSWGHRSIPIGRSSKLPAYPFGACATIFPRSIAKAIVEYGARKGWRGQTYRGTIKKGVEKEATDTFIGYANQVLGREIWGFNPSLVEHDAVESSLGHGGSWDNRTSLRFPGADADPFELFHAQLSETRYQIL